MRFNETIPPPEGALIFENRETKPVDAAPVLLGPVSRRALSNNGTRLTCRSLGEGCSPRNRKSTTPHPPTAGARVLA